MVEIVGIVCVYGVAVSLVELLAVLDIDDMDDINLAGLKPSGLSVFTHPDWEDMIILGVPIVQLDVDPSLTGSTMAPVITLPDITDFTPYTEERPMYYQVPIYE